MQSAEKNVQSAKENVQSAERMRKVFFKAVNAMMQGKMSQSGERRIVEMLGNLQQHVERIQRDRPC